MDFLTRQYGLIKERIALCKTANELLVSGQIGEAEAVANELLRVINSPEYPAFFRERGNGLYCVYAIRGIAAVQREDFQTAAENLTLAGESPPSPARQSFGPNMILPKMLLAAGETQVVIEFLDNCRSTWPLGGDEIDLWLKQITAGDMPDFGANLDYGL